MLIRHSKTSNRFVLPTSLSTSLTMNWSVWHLSVLFLLNTTSLSRPYSFLIRLTSISSSQHSKTKRVNALLETSLHYPLPLPCPLPTPLRLHTLPASSVVDSTSRETAMKSTKHLKLRRNSCKSASIASRGRSRQRMQTPLLLSLHKERLLRSNLLVMQMLSPRACADWNTDTGASSVKG